MSVLRTVRTFDPASFAFVMATGIVAVAAATQGHERIGLALFGLAVVAYVAIGAVTAARLALYPRTFLTDVTDYDTGLSLLTSVAATCLVGSAGVRFVGVTRFSVGLLWLGALLWVVLVYGVFIALTVHARERPLEDRIHGGWLLVTVATQSVALLAALVAPTLGGAMRIVLFAALALYLLGGALYLVLITLVVYRIVVLGLEPTAIGPPYWINAGAVAITTLTGSTLLVRETRWAFLATLDPFVRGLTLLFWVTATWWIPMLVVLGVWRHLVGDVALPYTGRGYDVSYWSIVFPLGMYTAATERFAVETRLSFLGIVPQLFVYLALLAWGVTSLGLAHSIATRVGTWITADDTDGGY
jgi:tellurite resistance protein TehA-like permease